MNYFLWLIHSRRDDFWRIINKQAAGKGYLFFLLFVTRKIIKIDTHKARIIKNKKIPKDKIIPNSSGPILIGINFPFLQGKEKFPNYQEKNTLVD